MNDAITKTKTPCPKALYAAIRKLYPRSRRARAVGIVHNGSTVRKLECVRCCDARTYCAKWRMPKGVAAWQAKHNRVCGARIVADAAHADYAGLFASDADAIAYEHETLSIGEEFLPDCAVAVLRGGLQGADPWPPAEYWVWLSEQVQQERAERAESEGGAA